MATPITTAYPDPRPETDGVLLDRVTQGDADALAVLYDRHGARVHSVAHLLCGGGAAVPDVVRDVFLAVWRGADRFDPAEGPVATWVLALTRDHAVEVLRRGTGTPPAGGGSQAAHAILGPMRAALAGLPDLERRALTLLHFGGYTQREVAAILAMPLCSVGALTASAVSRLHTVGAPGRDIRTDG